MANGLRPFALPRSYAAIIDAPLLGKRERGWGFAARLQPFFVLLAGLARYSVPKLPFPPWPFASPRPDALSPPPPLPLRRAHNTRRYGHPLFGVSWPIGAGLCAMRKVVGSV